METILNKKEQMEAEEMIEFIKTLSTEEQKNVKIFIQGIRFAQATEQRTA
ncbi:hypothetical protein [Anaerosinus massiliensis]|nr:hypothetical protein [Massilibacillus massiliensis]